MSTKGKEEVLDVYEEEDVAEEDEDEESPGRSYVVDKKDKPPPKAKFPIGHEVWFKSENDGSYKMTVEEKEARGRKWFYQISYQGDYGKELWNNGEWVSERSLKSGH